MSIVNQQEKLLVTPPAVAVHSVLQQREISRVSEQQSSFSRTHARVRAHRLSKEREDQDEDIKALEFAESLKELEETIKEKEAEMNFPNEVEEEHWSKADKINKFKTRAARYLSTRPIMQNAFATLLGDDLMATVTGLLRNVKDGVLNFANASEEAFKGFLKFILNVSSVGITDGILNLVGKMTLPEYLREDARNIMRLPFEALSSKEALMKELKEDLQLSAPWDHLNNFNIMEGWSHEQRYLELFRAKKALRFAQSFNPTDEELEKVKNFHMAVRFFESGVKGSLWASIPFLNRMFRSHVLKADGFTGIKGAKNIEHQAPKVSPLQNLARITSLGTGFIFQGAVIGLHKASKGTSKFANWALRNTNFVHGLYPTKSALYMNQGIAYDLGRLANSQEKPELYESEQITTKFTPALYFGDILTRFIGKMSDKKLAAKHGMETGILINPDAKKTGLMGFVNKILPPELEYGDMIQKVSHDDNLKRDAKLAHADMTLNKLLLHSLIVLITRMSINKHTAKFAKGSA